MISISVQIIRKVFAWLIPIVLGLLFLWAAQSKLTRPPDFLAVVYGYQILGERAGLLAAIALPSAELSIGVALIVGFAQRSALLVASLLLAMFVVAQISVLARNLAVECGCWGIVAQSAHNPGTVSLWTVMRTCALLLLALGAILALRRPSAIRPAHAPK